MQNFMQQLFSNVPVLVTSITLVVVGLVAIYGLLDREFKTRMKEKLGEENSLDDRIKTLYKEESAAQEKRITDLTKKLLVMEEDIKRLSTENRVMRDVLQGKDSQSVEFQKMGMDSMKQFAEMQKIVYEQHKISLENREETRQVNRNVERLAKAIETYIKKNNPKKSGGGENE